MGQGKGGPDPGWGVAELCFPPGTATKFLHPPPKAMAGAPTSRRAVVDIPRSALNLPPWDETTPDLGQEPLAQAPCWLGALWASQGRDGDTHTHTHTELVFHQDQETKVRKAAAAIRQPAPPIETQNHLFFCLFLSPPREVSSHQILPGSPSKGKRPPHPLAKPV